MSSIAERNDAIRWAQGILANKDQYVIIDTETTGLKDDDLVIHLAVMDLDGNMLIDTPIKPLSKRRINSEAKYLHGFGIKDLKNAPLLADVIFDLKAISESRTFLSYNAPFHLRMIEQSIQNEGLLLEMVMNGRDVKLHYIDFSGKYNPPLPNRKNTGIGDCMATLELIKIMAAYDIMPEPVEHLRGKEAKSSAPPQLTLSKWGACLFWLIIFSIVFWIVVFI